MRSTDLYRYHVRIGAMKRVAAFLLLACVAQADTASERLGTSASVFREIMDTPDKAIPQDLLGNAECIVIVPGMKKGAFILGANFGRGFFYAARRRRDGRLRPAYASKGEVSAFRSAVPRRMW